MAENWRNAWRIVVSLIAMIFCSISSQAYSKEKFYFCVALDEPSGAFYKSGIFVAEEQADPSPHGEEFADYLKARDESLRLGDFGCSRSFDRAELEDLHRKMGNVAIVKTIRDIQWQPGRSLKMTVENVIIDENGKSGSLAIDRAHGDRYGWAIDYATSAEADERALAECARNGGSCQVVLRFTGGCGAYAVGDESGTAFGWGTDRDGGNAQNTARSEVLKRGGSGPAVRAWGCNTLRGSAATASGKDTRAQAAADARKQERARQEKAERDETAALNENQRLIAEADVARNRAALAKAAEDQNIFEQERQRYEQAKAANDLEVATAKAAMEEYERQKAEYDRKMVKL